jgi:DNA-binding IclR family transcriptional regulator
VSGSGTQAVDRAALLLSRVVLADVPPGFTELVADTGLPKSTVSRLLQALERHQLVHRDGSGGYEPGSLFTRFASGYEPYHGLVALAMPTLERIGQQTRETVNLAVVRGRSVVQVAQVDSTYLLGTVNWVDVDVPPHCSALGKVFYASGSLPIPTEALERRTANTVTSPDRFAAQLAQIQRDGYAVALGELEVGLDAVATPLLDSHGKVVAAIGVSGPSDRIHNQLPRLGELLKAEARELSRVLGHDTRKEGAA